jgi:DNA replication protein DnaD
MEAQADYLNMIFKEQEYIKSGWLKEGMDSAAVVRAADRERREREAAEREQAERSAMNKRTSWRTVSLQERSSCRQERSR